MYSSLSVCRLNECAMLVLSGTLLLFNRGPTKRGGGEEAIEGISDGTSPPATDTMSDGRCRSLQINSLRGIGAA